MFFKEARKYIMKLIRIQSCLMKKGYTRADQATIVEAITYLKKYLSYYRYDSDEKMKAFFERNRSLIRTLIPGESYPGYQKLMNEFINFSNR